MRTRAALRPDPEYDPVLAVFYHVHNDWTDDSEGVEGAGAGAGGGAGGGGGGGDRCRLGVIAVDIKRCKFVARSCVSPRKGRAADSGHVSDKHDHSHTRVYNTYRRLGNFIVEFFL